MLTVERFLSKTEAAAACQRSESTIQRWCHKGGLEHRYNRETNELEVSVDALIVRGHLAPDAPERAGSGPPDAEALELADLRVQRAELAARVDELNARIGHLSAHIGFMEALARKAGLI